jgi:hypothetical protein
MVYIMVHFTVFCYILWTFCIVRDNFVYFYPVLVFCTEKNLATLIIFQVILVCRSSFFRFQHSDVNIFDELNKSVILNWQSISLGKIPIDQIWSKSVILLWASIKSIIVLLKWYVKVDQISNKLYKSRSYFN